MMVAGDAHRPIESPSPTLPKGRELLANALDTAGKSPRPLGRVGEGLSIGRGGAYSPQKTGEPTVKVGIPG